MKNSNTLYHALLVGGIAAIAILISGWMGIKAWVVFFAWANYFLHACSLKKSFKMLLAFFVGIFVAAMGSYTIDYLDKVVASVSELYVSAFVVFWIASLLILFEIIKGWREFVPATFLGTVLFFASSITFSEIIPELLPPLLIGSLAGYATIVSRNKLTIILTKQIK